MSLHVETKNKMKFNLYSTVAIILYICCVQICQCVDDETKREYLKYNKISDLDTYLDGNDALKDINPEFIEDVKFILEKFDDNLYVTGHMLTMMDAFANKFDGKDSKINLTTMKDHILKEKAEAQSVLPMENDVCSIIDRMSILPTLLLKELPAERVGGVINLNYLLYGGLADKDMENALGYLYGTESRPLAPNPDIPLQFSEKCTVTANGTIPNYIHTEIEHLKSLNSTNLNPKVFTDAQIIADNFRYNFDVLHILEFMRRFLTNLSGISSKVEICELKNQKRPWFDVFYGVQTAKFRIIDLETILPTRVPEENFMDMLNLLRANWGIDGGDWKKALEYAYTPEYFNMEWCNQNVATNSKLNP